VLPEFSITVRNLLDVHLVALHGELDVVSAEGLADSLVELAGSILVADLSDLSFMDSSGIGALVRARDRIKAEDLGDLVLTRPGVTVRRVLDIMGLDAWVVEWSPDWSE
jgi:anti-anti-sigma factor